MLAYFDQICTFFKKYKKKSDKSIHKHEKNMIKT